MYPMTTTATRTTTKTVSSVSLKDRTNDLSTSSKGAEELEEELEESERSFESDWSRDENPYDASNSFLTKIIKTHKKAMETSEEERRRLKGLLFKAEDRCEELLEMNEHLERELEKKEKQFLIKMEEEKTKGKQFPEREKMEIRERKLESELQAVKTMNESLERQVLSLKIRERERGGRFDSGCETRRRQMKSSYNHRNASAATTEQMLRDEIRSEEQKEQQTLAVIAETYAIEIRKLKEKVEMYEKARMREKAFGFQQKHQQQQQREKQQQYFSFEESEDGEENDDEPRPPLTVAKRLPSESESPFGTLNSEGRVKAAIVRLGILDDNGDVPKMRNF